MACGFEVELARGREVEQPCREHAVVDHGRPRGRQSLGIERPAAQSALAQRIVEDADAGRENAFAHLVFQKRRAARDGPAVDGAGEMADQAARDTAVIDHRHAGALRLARVEAADGVFPGGTADLCGRHQILEMHGTRPFVVAFHAGALAGENGAGQGVTAAAVAAAETIGGREHNAGSAPARLGALGIGHALGGARGVLGLRRHREQFLGGGPSLVVEIEVGPALRQQLRRSDAASRIFRYHASHVDGTTGQLAQRSGCKVGRGDEGLALAHEHAQAEIAAFAALELFALAQSLGDRDRLAVDKQGVGRVSASLLRPLQQVDQEIGIGGTRDRLHLGSLLRCS